MLSTKIIDYLADHQIPYSLISHQPTYTASQTAEATHIPGQHFAKVVVMKINNELSLVVLPANFHVDFKNLQKVAHTDKVEIAREYEFNQEFPECEIGAMPPFGDLYEKKVYLAESLAHQDWIACNAGTHAEILKIKGEDFLKLVHPTLLPNC